MNSLKSGSQGDWAFRHLSRTKLPFRIPTSYTKERRQDVAEATFAPIFADKPLIRYRKDTLEAGLKAHPEYDTAENRLALTSWRTSSAIRNSPPLPAGRGRHPAHQQP